MAWCRSVGMGGLAYTQRTGESKRRQERGKRTESRITRRDVEIPGRISSDGEVPAGVHAVGSSGDLHGILERGDVGAVGDQGDDVLRARVPRREGVGDVAAEAARVVAHAVAARVGRRCGRDGWAYRPVGFPYGLALPPYSRVPSLNFILPLDSLPI
jgi:hypothetical protein